VSLAQEISDGLGLLEQIPGLIPFDCRRQTAAFEQYLALLQKWNRTFNLTAIRDSHNQVFRHLLDSLVLLPYLTADRIADVGTGAGLPGIPLAIMQPKRQFVLVDANSKKTRFVNQVKLDLGLDAVQVCHDRVETLNTPPFDQIICRAFKPIDQLVSALSHLLTPEGAILAMVGKPPEASVRAQLSKDAEISLIPLEVPGLDASRFLLEIKLKAEIIRRVEDGR
jgi:16S rRNA (guanine527-N7)-methyltransferase